MTSKTQNIAMFAIAAFALGGMAISPVFASTSDYVYAGVTANTGISTGSLINDNDCGDSSDYCQAKAKSYTSSNKVKVYYGTSGTNCDVYSVLKKGGSFVDDYTKNDHSGTGNYWTAYTTVNNGDSFTVTNHYTDCK